jgi:transcriptional regulator with XRE-family HTH domain
VNHDGGNDGVTDTHNSDAQGAGGGELSLLPPADLGLRVLPAQLARLAGVSRQTVSMWVKKGWVALGPDGRVCPRAAIDGVLRHSGGRIRARALKPLTDDLDSLRRQIKEQTERAEAAELQAQALAAELEQARASERLFMAISDQLDSLIREREADLRGTGDSEEWGGLVDELYEQAEALAGATMGGGTEPERGQFQPFACPACRGDVFAARECGTCRGSGEVMAYVPADPEGDQ